MKLRKGFTLIELLVVFSLISLLAGIAGVSYTSYLRQSRDVKRKADMEQLRVALEMYKNDNGGYPDTASVWYSSESGDVQSNNGGNYITGLVPNYIPQLPRDPIGGLSTIKDIPNGCFYAGSKKSYQYRSDGKDYKLLSHCALESGNYLTSDPFYDPMRPDWAWQVSSSPAVRGNPPVITGW